MVPHSCASSLYFQRRGNALYAIRIYAEQTATMSQGGQCDCIHQPQGQHPFDVSSCLRIHRTGSGGLSLRNIIGPHIKVKMSRMTIPRPLISRIKPLAKAPCRDYLASTIQECHARSRTPPPKPAPFPVSPISPPIQQPAPDPFDISDSEIPSMETLWRDVYRTMAENEPIIKPIPRPCPGRTAGPCQCGEPHYDSEDDYVSLRRKHWMMMKANGIEPSGKLSNIKRWGKRLPNLRPRAFATQRLNQVPNLTPRSKDGNITKNAIALSLNIPDAAPSRSSIKKAGPAPFPMSPPTSPLLSSTPAEIIVPNPSPNPPSALRESRFRSVEAIIAEGKRRKAEETGSLEWTPGDEGACLYKEHWRMMRALGIETVEKEEPARYSIFNFLQ
ncbi:hypothetical protein DFP72DRAFT_911385 [Ephemerocybe angulata]|uniref:Uncharacterized protein n=1 Tax=Ephemerocybe angulata TaxID=980116 RepID=A0A8H6HP73_9AGAR|nr:hypothetical protein DFP72DRAFT_911385 [Tulosesus angulatus]